ncbi:MAG: hypothetical protein WBG02_02900 [Candidatus Acidiferrum sp.]
MSRSRLVWLAAILLVLANASRVSGNDDDLLNKKLSLDAQKATAVNYIISMLRQSGASGGIEEYDSGCGAEPDMQIPALNGTLGDGLSRMNQLAKSINWRTSDEELLVVKGSPESSILDTRIEQFTFNANAPPNKSTGAILASPAVSKSIAQQRLIVGSPELGFAQPRNQSERKVVLKNVTMREALNSVAKSSHPRVWLFRQRTCDGHKNLTVSWVVK